MQQHPMEKEAHLPDGDKLADWSILTEGRHAWAEKAEHNLDRPEKERKELEPRTEELESKPPKTGRKVISKKQTQLGKESLKEVNSRDVEVAVQCPIGFPLVGDLDATGCIIF